MADALTDQAGLPANEQTQNYGGQALGQYAVTAGGIPTPAFADRDVTTAMVFMPSQSQIADIAKANQMTGAGVQGMAGNLANAAAQGVGGNSAQFDSSGKATNPILKTTAQEDYEAARMILSETHGSFATMVRIAEVLRNRTLIAQSGQAKKAGTPSAPTVQGQIYAPGQFSAYNSLTGFAGGAGSNYLATQNYTGNEPDFQKALRAWETAKAGSNLTKGSTNFWATYIGSKGLPVQAADGENLYLSPTNGYTYQSSALAAAGASVQSPTGTVQAQSPGQYIANNVRHNNAAQTMQKQGHQPTVAEASMLGLPNYSPNVAAAWGRAMAQKKGHKTVKELIMAKDQDSAAWQQFVSQYAGKVSHPSMSPIEHLKVWIHSFFRPHKNVGLQKWNLLGVNINFMNSVDPTQLASNIAPALASAISLVDNTWTNIGPDGPIAHGVQNVLANLLTPVALNAVQPSTAGPTAVLQHVNQIAQANTLQLSSALGDPVTLALHSEAILNNLAAVPSSQIIANLAFPGSTYTTTVTMGPVVIGASQ